jgi:hypothetical protein
LQSEAEAGPLKNPFGRTHPSVNAETNLRSLPCGPLKVDAS